MVLSGIGGLMAAIGTAAGATASTAAATGAAIVGAGAAAAGAATSAGLGIAANKQQQDAMEQQKKAQNAAVARAGAQQRLSEQAQAMANKKQPDYASIMDRASMGAGGGASSTMLTGPGGVNPGALSLGQSSLLGG
ncbi:MAG: hypothetical protein EBR07_03925 [Planctomycetes bacterium]|nr:hypothetical protein [Planctomycetota bacterium]